jgi:hypothetical protein
VIAVLQASHARNKKARRSVEARWQARTTKAFSLFITSISSSSYISIYLVLAFAISPSTTTYSSLAEQRTPTSPVLSRTSRQGLFIYSSVRFRRTDWRPTSSSFYRISLSHIAPCPPPSNILASSPFLAIPNNMSPPVPPRKLLARNIDEKKAEPHDLLITYASSLSNPRLLPLQEWLRAGSPTGHYEGPPPTYQLKFNWSNVEVDGPVSVVCRAMEECFGSITFSGWKIWIRGDQLVLLMQDFRKEYLRIRGLNLPRQWLLDNWLLAVLNEMQTA